MGISGLRLLHHGPHGLPRFVSANDYGLNAFAVRVGRMDLAEDASTTSLVWGSGAWHRSAVDHRARGGNGLGHGVETGAVVMRFHRLDRLHDQLLEVERLLGVVVGIPEAALVHDGVEIAAIEM